MLDTDVAAWAAWSLEKQVSNYTVSTLNVTVMLKVETATRLRGRHGVGGGMVLEVAWCWGRHGKYLGSCGRHGKHLVVGGTAREHSFSKSKQELGQSPTLPTPKSSTQQPTPQPSTKLNPTPPPPPNLSLIHI